MQIGQLCSEQMSSKDSSSPPRADPISLSADEPQPGAAPLSPTERSHVAVETAGDTDPDAQQEVPEPLEVDV